MKELTLLGFTLSLIFSTSALYAQEEGSEPEPKKMNAASFGIGYGNFPSADLAVFAPGALDFSPHHFIFAINNTSMSDRFVLSSNILGSFGRTASNDTMEATFSGAYIGIGFGYLIVDQQKFKIYPMLGGGFGVYGVEMSQTGDLSLQQVQQSFKRGINIHQMNFALDFSLNLDFIPKLTQREDGSYSSFLTGLKLGYLHNFATDNWRYTGGKITGGPSFGMQGFYLQLNIGAFSTNRL